MHSQCVHMLMLSIEGELSAYVEKLGWTLDASTGVVAIPPNPDNQIESTVVQENIQLPRQSIRVRIASHCLADTLCYRIGQGYHPLATGGVMYKSSLYHYTLHAIFRCVYRLAQNELYSTENKRRRGQGSKL